MHGTLPLRTLVSNVATVFLLAGAAGCVRTAECDAQVPCEAGEVCYDFVCRPTCATVDDCQEGTTCLPCQQDDAQGTIDHCFESPALACVALEGE